MIKLTIKDYKNALKEFYKHPENKRAEKTVKECARFFERDFDLYAMGADLDGKKIKEKIEKKVLEEMRKCMEKS